MAYRLIFDRHNYLTFDIDLYEIESKHGDPFVFDDNDESFWAKYWKELNAVFRDDSDAGNVISPPQITTWFTNQIVLDQHAYEKIGRELAQSCEILPVQCEGVRYWVCHITARLGLEVVDVKRSERTIDAADYIEAYKITFFEEKIDDLVFKTAYNGFRNIYCTEKFKKLVEDNDLQGLIFSKNMATAPE